MNLVNKEILDGVTDIRLPLLEDFSGKFDLTIEDDVEAQVFSEVDNIIFYGDFYTYENKDVYFEDLETK